MSISVLISLIIIALSISFAVYIEMQIRRGSVSLATDYSYKKVVVVSLEFLLGAIVVSCSFFLYFKSLEYTIALLAFMSVCILAGFLKGMLFEYQIKRRLKK